ncbi:hypothetical protein MHLP_02090 [Candidatus Mycoplasma haematolamae str. Purdue]|uniref:Uncharacterized protein n=1 Tax=Mycoplasma haematolamae (strain Purdue) TaxID=1212765 RepID=I7BJH1_MYCHA|nr:hypothetical protein MHLP_02090 [Candidatus Mycoplasma haematolamae str. Purdue]
MKAIVPLVFGAGSVVGGGFRVVEMVKPANHETLEKVVKESSPSSSSAESDSLNLQTEVLANADEVMTEAQDPSVKDSDDEEEEEDLEILNGKLVLTKGNPEEWFNEEYVLEVYFSEGQPSNLGVSVVDFSTSDREKVERYLRLFNTGVSFNSYTFEGFLEGLQEERTKFEKIFGAQTYLTLEGKVQKLVKG